MLLGASISDLRTRRVPNVYWWPWFAAATALLLGDLAQDPAATLLGFAWSAGTASVLYALWYFGLFGGADAKGLMVLALLWPTPPAILDGASTPAIDALVNASTFVAILPILFLLWNLTRGHIGGPMLLGIRMDRETARGRHVWPMERVEDGVVRIRLWQRIGAPLDEAYNNLEKAGVQRVWATPKVPFMIGILVGIIIAYRYGNLLLLLMVRLLS